MLKKGKEFFTKTVLEPVSENLTAVMFWGGMIAIIAGVYFEGGVSEFLLKSGGAVLGGGVFAVIVKSSQFTELFQKHINEVFYNPMKIGSGIDAIGKWRILTESMLKDNLPNSYLDATKKLEENFFNSELDYHFEDHNMKYDITINDDIATVISSTDTTIILSDNKNDPVMHQSVTGRESTEIKSLFLNGVQVTEENCKFFQDTKNPHIMHLEVHLNDYKNTEGDNSIRMERVFSWKQELKSDPIISGYISRYVKGFALKVKISEGYKLKFSTFNGVEISDDHHHLDDGSGYERWQLAEAGTLMLPAQGFFCVIIKE